MINNTEATLVLIIPLYRGFVRGAEGETPVCVDFKVTSEGQCVLATVSHNLLY